MKTFLTKHLINDTLTGKIILSLIMTLMFCLVITAISVALSIVALLIHLLPLWSIPVILFIGLFIGVLNTDTK